MTTISYWGNSGIFGKKSFLKLIPLGWKYLLSFKFLILSPW